MIAKMAMGKFLECAVVVSICFSVVHSGSINKHKSHVGRPKVDPYCQSVAVSFCPNGRDANTMPSLSPNDTLYVYALKAPMWEFPFGDVLAQYHIMREAVGFHHVQSGANFTMEWSGLGDVFNGTFPHETTNQTLVWCNQAATCISNGIDEAHWKDQGVLVKVAEINGTVFNSFAKWTEEDNSTVIFYQTWTVWNLRDDRIVFDSVDSGSWVQRAFEAMARSGATFDQSVQLRYARINIFSNKHEKLGTASEAFKRKRLARSILKFYKWFQPRKTISEMVRALYEAFYEIVLYREFYFYINETYYLLGLEEPMFSISYQEVPLPKK